MGGRRMQLEEQFTVLTLDWHCRYLPAIGRFLIVVTFLEDAIRIITQWSDQLIYLKDYRHSMWPVPFLPISASPRLKPLRN